MTKKQRLIAKCKKHGLELEEGNFADKHRYNVWYNFPSGTVEILCKNLNECEHAINELIKQINK